MHDIYEILNVLLVPCFPFRLYNDCHGNCAILYHIIFPYTCFPTTWC